MNMVYTRYLPFTYQSCVTCLVTLKIPAYYQVYTIQSQIVFLSISKVNPCHGWQHSSANARKNQVSPPSKTTQQFWWWYIPDIPSICQVYAIHTPFLASFTFCKLSKKLWKFEALEIHVHSMALQKNISIAPKGMLYQKSGYTWSYRNGGFSTYQYVPVSTSTHRYRKGKIVQTGTYPTET